MIANISNSALDIIKQYQNLDFGKDKKVQCPYFRNYRKRGGTKLRSLSGKGTPEEIVDEVRINSHLLNFNIKNKNPEEIKQFMEEYDIGIDCSGFVLWVIKFWLRKEYRINLFSKIRSKYRTNFIKWIRLLLRPAQNIDVEVLTSEKVSTKLKDWKKAKPGDMIRAYDLKVLSGKGRHVMLIIEIEKNEQEQIQKIKYAHSTREYGSDSGVKIGEIEIIDQTLPLSQQKWLEVDEKGRSWIHKAFDKNNDRKNGIYRLRMLLNTD